MNPADEGLFVVEPADEEQLFAERRERFENFTQLHSGAFALGPPLAAVEPVAGEEDREPYRRPLAARASDSSHGSAIVTPTPRRKVRRLRFMIKSSSADFTDSTDCLLKICVNL